MRTSWCRFRCVSLCIAVSRYVLPCLALSVKQGGGRSSADFDKGLVAFQVGQPTITNYIQQLDQQYHILVDPDLLQKTN